jgi:hypothetical protein
MDRSDVRNAWRDLDFWLEVNMKYRIKTHEALCTCQG